MDIAAETACSLMLALNGHVANALGQIEGPYISSCKNPCIWCKVPVLEQVSYYQ